MIDNIKKLEDDILKKTLLKVDYKFHINKNMDKLAKENIDEYFADNFFWKRDT